jgi:hypothetical protein
MANTKTSKPKKKTRGTVHVLTEDQKVCAHLYIKHGSSAGANKAAEMLGVPADAVKTLIKTPAVQRYLQQYNHAFLKEMARFELAKVTRFPVCRDDVIGRLYTLALTPPEETKGTIEGQVKAVETIADILGLKFNPRDADTFFKDRTPQELENYARYGKFDPTEEEKAALDAATKPTPQS